jgi:hypothetical protein
MSSSTALQPSIRILVQSASPISPADTQAHLATFLDGYKARASAGTDDTGRGDMEGDLLSKLVMGLDHEVSK